MTQKESPLRDLYVTRPCIARSILESVLLSNDSALSQALTLSLKKRDWAAFVSASINPMDYSCADDFRQDYLISEMFSKYPYWDLRIDRSKVALEKFLQSEAQCLQTNARLNSPGTWSFEATSVIHTAGRKIAELLGPFSWDEAAVGFDFGPGGTTRLRRKHADRYYKLSGIPETTMNNLPLATAALAYNKAWGIHASSLGSPPLVVVPGNKIITVPKNAKTDRVIAVEPCMNIFVQKGIGSMIKRRLRKVKVDLTDQTHNQRLAQAGSVDGSLATLDLSSASDTVSYEIVRELLPPDWFDALCACRTDRGVLPSGEVLFYRKFSSMGNGFTFELESLIFWAICSAVRSLSVESDRRMAVYGDDIIVPTGLVPMVIRSLEFAGFMVNPKKSHVDGPFRESCGAHYFNGHDVTPIYIKDRVDSYPRYIWCANQLKRWSAHSVYGLRSELRQTYELVRGRISGYWSKAMIPDGCGDGALIGDFDEVVPNKAPNGWHGWRVSLFTQVRLTIIPSDTPILLKSLWGLEKSGSQWKGTTDFRPSSLVAHDNVERQSRELQDMSYLDVPLETRKYQLVKSGVVWQWNDLGPWQG